MSNKVIIGVVILAVAIVVWARLFATPQDSAVIGDDDLISTKGIHWHPTLKIVIRGEEVPIPANIGLMGGHNPMHTHETDGTIHLEFDGVVRKNSIRLRKFFELWGKEFSRDQIMEHINTETERVRMYVDGEESNEFEEYLFKGDEAIEIRFE